MKTFTKIVDVFLYIFEDNVYYIKVLKKELFTFYCNFICYKNDISMRNEKKLFVARAGKIWYTIC